MDETLGPTNRVERTSRLSPYDCVSDTAKWAALSQTIPLIYLYVPHNQVQYDATV